MLFCFFKKFSDDSRDSKLENGHFSFFELFVASREKNYWNNLKKSNRSNS